MTSYATSKSPAADQPNPTAAGEEVLGNAELQDIFMALLTRIEHLKELADMNINRVKYDEEVKRLEALYKKLLPSYIWKRVL